MLTRAPADGTLALCPFCWLGKCCSGLEALLCLNDNRLQKRLQTPLPAGWQLCLMVLLDDGDDDAGLLGCWCVCACVCVCVGFRIAEVGSTCSWLCLAEPVACIGNYVLLHLPPAVALLPHAGFVSFCT